MYLCLSSASREGYSKDVVDTLAAPVGGERQFRYDQIWVEPAIRQLVDQGKVPADAKCLLCFIDLRGNPKDPFVLPLREATLLRVIPVGSTYTLVFRLGAFRRPSDMREFSKAARKALPDLHRVEASQGKREPKGFLWIDAKDELDPKLKPVAAKGNWALEWEKIVCNYLDVMNAPDQFASEFHDKDALTSMEGRFKDESPFYVFYDLKSVPGGARVESQSEADRTAFKLSPDNAYELSFYHYHPSKAFPKVRISLKTTHEGVRIVGNDSHAFNTRYDVKRFTLATTNVLSGARGNILVSRVFQDGAASSVVEDFYLECKVNRNVGKLAWFAVVIAALFAIPQFMILCNSTPAVGPAQYIVVSLFALALGGFATLKDLFRLK